MARTLLIATTRKEKTKEIINILKDLKFKFITLADINFPKIEPKEDGETYVANAIIKAKFYGKKSGFLTLADDTGLEVDALSHKLGVKSKRYTNGTDKDRYQKLLKEMENVPLVKRKARFVSIVALFEPKTAKLKITQGICQGRIANKPKGIHGFGYDPVFIVNSLNKYNAQLTLAEKNKVSSRAKALKKMKKYLKKYELKRI